MSAVVLLCKMIGEVASLLFYEIRLVMSQGIVAFCLSSITMVICIFFKSSDSRREIRTLVVYVHDLATSIRSYFPFKMLSMRASCTFCLITRITGNPSKRVPTIYCDYPPRSVSDPLFRKFAKKPTHSNNEPRPMLPAQVRDVQSLEAVEPDDHGPAELERPRGEVRQDGISRRKERRVFLRGGVFMRERGVD